MPFEKGQSGNPTGRKKGSENKETKIIRQWIGAYLTDNLQTFEDKLGELSAKDYVSSMLGLMEYSVPKLARIEHSGDEGGDFIVRIVTPPKKDA